MKAFTDASISEHFSVHSYVLYSESEILLQYCETRLEADTQKAELISIILLLNKCKEKQLTHVTIHTDNQAITRTSDQHKSYGHLIKEMNELLEEANSILVWIGRKSNKAAHNICKAINRKLYEAKNNNSEKDFNISDYLLLKEERKFSEGFKNAGVGNRCTRKEKSHIKTYYESFVQPERRKPLEQLLSWGDKERNCNTKRGRRLFVERFIERHHTVSEIKLNKTEHIFNKMVLDNLQTI